MVERFIFEAPTKLQCEEKIKTAPEGKKSQLKGKYDSWLL